MNNTKSMTHFTVAPIMEHLFNSSWDEAVGQQRCDGKIFTFGSHGPLVYYQS